MTVDLQLRKTEWPKREFHGTPREASAERLAWREKLQELPVDEAFEHDIDTDSADPDEQRKAVGRTVQKIKSAAADVGVTIKLARTSPSTLQVDDDGVATIVIKRVANSKSSDQEVSAWPGDVEYSDSE